MIPPACSAPHGENRSRSYVSALLSALLIALFATGCSSIKPTPITHADIHTKAAAGRIAAAEGVEPLTDPLTLEEAVARALKYNLDQRSRQLEQALASHVWRAGTFDMLPNVLANAGYRHRSNDLITNSVDSVTGLPSLANPSISSDRNHRTADLSLSWSVVDFTLGYYNARQNADRVLIAAEHRRKAMHALTRDVTVAFWRMASAQALLDEVRETIARAESALAEASAANDEGLRSPVDNLRYQRQLLENIRLLSNIDKDFAAARAILANLINVPLGQEFTVIEPASPAALALLDIPVEQLEEIALLQNADLRDQLYQERIAVAEVRKTIAKLFPDLSVSAARRWSDDRFLINNYWNEAGLALSQNLVSLIAAPSRKRAADGGVALVAQRRLAVQMAVLAQVHIARGDLEATHRQLLLSERIWDIDQRIRGHSRDRAEVETESQLSRVATDTAAIVSRLRRYQALAEFNAASSQLQSTLGLELDLASIDAQPLVELTAAVAAWQSAWLTGRVDALAPVVSAD